MQKVIRRTLLAEKQAARRLAKRKDKNIREWAKTSREQVLHARRQETSSIKNARLNRREDYELGPLAPKRDVGDVKDTYGTTDGSRMRSQPIDPRKIEQVLKDVGYEKKWRTVHFVVGDRVVMLEGKDKGRIGYISAIDIPKGEATIEGMNMVEIEVPGWMNPEGGDETQTRPYPMPISLTSILLVHPIKLPGKPNVEDVIIKKIHYVKDSIEKDQATGKITFQRHVAGFPHLLLDLPESEPEQFTDFPGDTLRIEVDKRTFVPTLMRPPIPSSVIDELRNKFSVFRTRHDPEYIARKKEEDKEAARKKASIKEMRTPLKEINALERKLRKKKGIAARKAFMDPKMLASIGRVIAAKKALGLVAPKPRRETVAA